MYDPKKLVREHRSLSVKIRTHQAQADADGRDVEITPAYARDRLRRHHLSMILRDTGRHGLDDLLMEEDALNWCITRHPGDDDSTQWRRDRTRVRREIESEIDPEILSISQVTESLWRLRLALSKAFGIGCHLRTSGTPYKQTILWDQGPDDWPKTAAMKTGNGSFERYWLRVDAGMRREEAYDIAGITELELPYGVTVEIGSTILILKPEGKKP